VAEGSTVFHDGQQRKILVVDDSEIVLEVTRAALASAGHRVITYDRAAGCVALILQEKPDLVLMDVNMPHVGGDTIVGVVGKAQPIGGPVVLLYSSLSADILRVKADAVGAHGYIQKTGDLFALVREVNRWLKLGSSSSSSSGRMRAAVDVGQNPSSGTVRAAPEIRTPIGGRWGGAAELGASSSSTLRVGRDLGLPNGAQLSDESSVTADEGARSSGSRAVAPAVHSAEPAGAPSSTLFHGRVPTVLLVDRDMAVLSSHRRYLQADQFTVEYALSGAAALRRILSDSPPDVMVYEAFMPDLSGIDLYRRALTTALTWHERMILTADVQMPTPGRAFAEFKGTLLVKPVTADALRSAVRACIAAGGATQPGRATAT
jgi:CheY-like chemotaxis protein